MDAPSNLLINEVLSVEEEPEDHITKQPECLFLPPVKIEDIFEALNVSFNILVIYC